MPGEPAPERRTLVLAAFPAEADAVFARTALDPNPIVVAEGRHFYLGAIGGTKTIVAMTGIGLVNATRTTETAFARFTTESAISIGAVVFSGVAGGAGRTSIGDVAIPARWTLDAGTTWQPVDADMLAAARRLSVDLDGTKRLRRRPQLFAGGDGSTADNNNGQAFPCIPNGGSVFGCQPRHAPDRSLRYTGNFFPTVLPFVSRGLLSNLKFVAPPDPAFDAVDQETATVQAVADGHGVPFLGIRGMSDGPGDPLHLPGFPFQFFVYKRIAADNAARVTEAFLRAWPAG